MQEPARDVGELKREIVETRNQSIKTDNQVKNLALELRSFDKRFGQLEKRTRLAAIGTNVLLATVILGAAYLVHAVRVHALERAVEESSQQLASAKKITATAGDEMRRQLQQIETREQKRIEAEQVALQLLDHLDAGRDKQAVALLERLQLDDAGELGKRLATERVAELRRRAGEAAYRAGRSHLTADRVEAALPELQRALQFDPEARYATSARYMLATNLWGQKRWEEANVVLRDMMERKPNKPLREEIRFLLAMSLARLGKREEATELFKQLITAGRYVGSSKAYVAALASGGALPPLPGQRRAAASAARPTRGPPAP